MYKGIPIARAIARVRTITYSLGQDPGFVSRSCHSKSSLDLDLDFDFTRKRVKAIALRGVTKQNYKAISCKRDNTHESKATASK